MGTKLMRSGTRLACYFSLAIAWMLPGGGRADTPGEDDANVQIYMDGTEILEEALKRHRRFPQPRQPETPAQPERPRPTPDTDAKHPGSRERR